jgi:hypothetical protein
MWVPADKTKERRFKRSDGRAEATYAVMDSGPTLTVRQVRAEREQRDQ